MRSLIVAVGLCVALAGCGNGTVAVATGPTFEEARQRLVQERIALDTILDDLDQQNYEMQEREKAYPDSLKEMQKTSLTLGQEYRVNHLKLQAASQRLFDAIQRKFDLQSQNVEAALSIYKTAPQPDATTLARTKVEDSLAIATKRLERLSKQLANAKAGQRSHIEDRVNEQRAEIESFRQKLLAAKRD